MTRPFVIGLTGSIGMGKSTTAAMFAENDIPVWSADAAVHELYSNGGAGSKAISELVPEAVENGSVNRATLRTQVAADPDLLNKIDAKIHPLVRTHRDRFVSNQAASIVVCEIPLLFETADQSDFDAIVVITTEPELQKRRVLERPGMTEEYFYSILARQMPDAEKRKRADYIIDTSSGLDPARLAVENILADIKSKTDA